MLKYILYLWFLKGYSSLLGQSIPATESARKISQELFEQPINENIWKTGRRTIGTRPIYVLAR